MRKYNGFQIKLFMAALMVLDHLEKIPGLVSFEWAGIFHALTRCVAVWFAYMAVEGFLHTRSRRRYVLRLFGWAAIMFLGNIFFSYLYREKEIILSNNIFLTLALGVLILCVVYGGKEETSAARKAVCIGAGVLIGVLAVCFAEGAILLLPFMVICYAFRENSKRRDMAAVCLAIPLTFISYVPYETWRETVFMMLYNCEGLFITVIPFLHLYNGQRGPSGKFSKYFFYVFYPAHLWIIAAIAYWVK